MRTSNPQLSKKKVHLLMRSLLILLHTMVDLGEHRLAFLASSAPQVLQWQHYSSSA